MSTWQAKDAKLDKHYMKTNKARHIRYRTLFFLIVAARPNRTPDSALAFADWNTRLHGNPRPSHVWLGSHLKLPCVATRHGKHRTSCGDKKDQVGFHMSRL